jgi:hemolysin type calcium-binding protein
VGKTVPLLAAVLLTMALAPSVRADGSISCGPDQTSVSFAHQHGHLTGLIVDNSCDYYSNITWGVSTRPGDIIYIVVAPRAKVNWDHADIHRLGLPHKLYGSGGGCCGRSLGDFDEFNPAHLIEADGKLVTWARATSCGGKRATIFSRMGDDPRLQNYIYGTAGDDVIIGTPARDSISTAEGNDIVCAGSGDDSVRGDEGRDLIYGGPGHDSLRGGLRNCGPSGSGNGDWYCDPVPPGDDDRLYGGEGNDQLVGGSGDDYLRGGLGDDDLYGNQGSDYVSGDQGKDRCVLAEATTDGDYSGPKDKASKTCETVVKKKVY